MKSELKVVVSLIAAFLILAASLHLAFSGLHFLVGQMDRNESRREIGRSITESMLLLKDARLGEQRYAIFEKKKDLERYRDAMRRAREKLTAALSSDLPDATEKRAIESMLQRIDRYDAWLRSQAERRRIAGMRSAIQGMLSREAADLSKRIDMESAQLVLDWDRKILEANLRTLEQGEKALRLRSVEAGVVFSIFLAGVLWVIRDLRVQKRRAQALEKAERAALEASRAKSEFVANMSHEIRTPMNAVVGMSDLMMDTPLSPEQENGIRVIRNSSLALLGIVNDILDFSKIESGKLVIERVPFALREAISGAMEIFRFQSQEKGVGLEWREEGDPPAAVWGDPTRLRQVIVNLVGNAMKFTDVGSVRVEVSPGAKASGVRFSVRDTGIGMSEETLRRIFEKFQQADSSTTRRYGGTGLGLSIARELVKLMGGELSVESQVGQGSVFSFTIPLEPASLPRLQEEHPGARSEERRAKKILVVEDDAMNRMIIMKLLERSGYTVTVVSGGIEALALVREHPDFSAILLDCQMPGMDGYEVAKRMRALPGIGASTPILAFTAHAFREEAQKCEAAGMNDFVTKPVEPALLERKLDQWIFSRRKEKEAA